MGFCKIRYDIIVMSNISCRFCIFNDCEWHQNNPNNFLFVEFSFHSSDPNDMTTVRETERVGDWVYRFLGIFTAVALSPSRIWHGNFQFSSTGICIMSTLLFCHSTNGWVVLSSLLKTPFLHTQFSCSHSSVSSHNSPARSIGIILNNMMKIYLRREFSNLFIRTTNCTLMMNEEQRVFDDEQIFVLKSEKS